MSDDLIKALQKELQEADDHIKEIEAYRNRELDFFLFKKKQMSRRIALLQGWMKKLFDYANSPHTKRNQFTMTTEIPDTLMREGEDYLRREDSDE